MGGGGGVCFTVVILLMSFSASMSSSNEGVFSVVVAPFMGFLAFLGATLMTIKSSFGHGASSLMGWDDAQNEDYCSWRGITCDNLTQSVVSLNLTGLNLGGEISPAIRDLKNLRSIGLQGNKLSGQIPDEIGNCASLRLLDLSDNMLQGDIPFSISKLKHIEILNLKKNQLTGPIPSTLTQLPNLKILDLALNQLTGEIPRLIYWNEVLQYLGLRGNSLTGTISPDICQLTGLWYFDVRGNNLTGTIPDSIGNCTSFEILDISYNEITGEIPYNIGFLQVATLSLQGNKLTGKIPEVLGLMQAIAVLDLSENELVGPIPPTLGNLSYTGKLYLHGNKLTGPIPPELGNMSKLSYLQLNNNQLSGTIPSDLGKLDQLFELNLANNNLEGPIPENISSCTALNHFDFHISSNVHGNNLNGSIPHGLHKLESLTYLNLSSNNFGGNIPIELGRIVNLDTLDLSCNNFSGSAPPSLGELEHLLILNVSSNHLVGPVPSDFGNLRSVQIIDMSFNELSGSIPSELGQMQNLESLILNDNNLQGPIPMQITNCFSLTALNVSNNNLSGTVPLAKSLVQFSPGSFVGNPLLCGNWSGSICGPHVPRTKAKLQWGLFNCIAAFFSKAAIVSMSIGIAALVLIGFPKLVFLRMNLAIHTYEDIMRVTENFNEKYIIGYGASSTVYKCALKNSLPAAIKRLCTQFQHNLQEFETELATIGSIRHRNLVSLHGYSLSPCGNLLFYDYMENGSLWDLLHGPSKKMKLDWETRLKIAIGAAQGLAYLHHDCNPRIIHRDVKSSNILLDENFEAHLSDFGIAKCIPSAKKHSSTYVVGTIGYIDPEYARTSRLTEKSDVYSFGIVLLELLTGKKAVDNDLNLHQLILSKTDDNTVMEAVDPEVSITCVNTSHVKLTFQLALLCTKLHPSDRPTMKEVARILGTLLPPPMPLPKKSASPSPEKRIDYSQFFIERGQRQQQQLDSSSDAQWFVRFGEVISSSTL
ncbi:LRR receptor-like serine/threonine-protein kinase ERL1-like protein [Drosera capensis]